MPIGSKAKHHYQQKQSALFYVILLMWKCLPIRIKLAAPTLIFLAEATVYNLCENPPTQNGHGLPTKLNPADRLYSRYQTFLKTSLQYSHES